MNSYSIGKATICCGVLLATLMGAWATAAAEEKATQADTKIEFNSVLKIGDAAPAWKDLPGTDGQKHSLEDLKSADVVVVVFTCNSCPTARDYEDRIMAFVKSHGVNPPTGGMRLDPLPQRVRLVAINVNKIAEDSLDKMKERAAERKFTFPYLFDDTQKIAKQFGAITTPEFFVLNKDRKIAFMGAMDDNSEPNMAKKNHLVEVVDALLKDSSLPVTSVAPRGCRIHFVQERKK